MPLKKELPFDTRLLAVGFRSESTVPGGGRRRRSAVVVTGISGTFNQGLLLPYRCRVYDCKYPPAAGNCPMLLYK
jgi:hypothetical protein